MNDIKGYYTPHYHFKSQLYKILKDNWQEFLSIYPSKYQSRYGELKDYQKTTVEKFLACSNPHNGFSYVECTNGKCGNHYVVPFTCQTEICPSCNEKQVLEFSDWLVNEVLFAVNHKHTVLTMPLDLREYFRIEPRLLGYLAASAGEMLIYLSRAAAKGTYSKPKRVINIPDDALPGIIVRIETISGDLQHNPHLHCIETCGCYSPKEKEDAYYPSGFIPYKVLRLFWMKVVLNLLVNFGKITKDDATRIRTKYKNGFNVNSTIRDHTGDDKLMYRQAQYIQKAPISETRIVDYNSKTRMVIIKFRRKDFDDTHKGYSTAKITALELIARLIQHIHYPHKHYTRYNGQYSVKRRGMRRKQNKKSNPNETGKNRKDCRSSWAKLIWKVYGANPLECPVCGSEMKITNIVTTDIKNKLKRLNIREWYYKTGDEVHKIVKARDSP